MERKAEIRAGENEHADRDDPEGSWMDDPEFRCLVDRHGYTNCRDCDEIEFCGDEDLIRAEKQDMRARQHNSAK